VGKYYKNKFEKAVRLLQMIKILHILYVKLKVLDNEKGGALGRWQMLCSGLGSKIIFAV
jgi:hypothetical protein